MPVSDQPLVERIARVLAAASFSSNAEGSDPSASEKIKKILYPFAPQPLNPVDAAADVRPMTYARVLDILMGLDYIDGILMMIPFMFSFQLRSAASVRELMDATEIICSLPEKYGKPILGNTIPSVAVGPSLEIFKKAGIPFFATQDESARAMHGLVRYRRISAANRTQISADRGQN